MMSIVPWLIIDQTSHPVDGVRKRPSFNDGISKSVETNSRTRVEVLTEEELNDLIDGIIYKEEHIAETFMDPNFDFRLSSKEEKRVTSYINGVERVWESVGKFYYHVLRRAPSGNFYANIKAHGFVTTREGHTLWMTMYPPKCVEDIRSGVGAVKSNAGSARRTCVIFPSGSKLIYPSLNTAFKSMHKNLYPELRMRLNDGQRVKLTDGHIVFYVEKVEGDPNE